MVMENKKVFRQLRHETFLQAYLNDKVAACAYGDTCNDHTTNGSSYSDVATVTSSNVVVCIAYCVFAIEP